MLCGIAWSLPALIFFRILQGAGGAALFPLSITMLFREFPPQERGIASGVFGVPALLAPAIGPTLGGYLVTYAGWQAIFFINLPIGILAIILVMLFIRETPIQANQRFDFLGFFFVALGLTLVLYGLSDASTDGWGSGQVIGSIIGGLIAIAIFVFVELSIVRREGRPLLDLRLFTNRPFTLSIIASLFVIFSLFGGVFLFPLYLQNLRGQSAFEAGLVLLPQALAAMVATIVGGRLVDRIGVRGVMIPGLLILALATWELSFLSLYSSYGWLQLVLIIRGLALGFCVQPLTVAGLSEIRPRQLAQASSLNTVARAVASSLGIAVLATLVQTQTQIHYGHLAQLVTPTSQLGQLLPRIQALFVSQGGDIIAARAAALQTISGLVQQQSYILAIQDAFKFSLVVTFLAIVAVLFVSKSRPKTPTPGAERNTATTEGLDEETSPRAMVFAE
jgi:DHA2 family multidrug resistance protein